MSDSVIRPEDAIPAIDYTLTELDGVVHNTQERVCKGLGAPLASSSPRSDDV